MKNFVCGDCGGKVFMVDVRLDYDIDSSWSNGAFGAVKVLENRERGCGKGRVLAKVQVDGTNGGFCGGHTGGVHDYQRSECSFEI